MTIEHFVLYMLSPYVFKKSSHIIIYFLVFLMQLFICGACLGKQSIYLGLSV